jgi:hypothetical protein
MVDDKIKMLRMTNNTCYNLQKEIRYQEKIILDSTSSTEQRKDALEIIHRVDRQHAMAELFAILYFSK